MDKGESQVRPLAEALANLQLAASKSPHRR